MNRLQRNQQRRKYQRRRIGAVLVAIFILLLIGISLFNHFSGKTTPLVQKADLTDNPRQPLKKTQVSKAVTQPKPPEPQKAIITASGDMLYHDILFRSAHNGKRYDLDNDYAQIKPIMDKADLSLGDFEGTINPERELTGYPLFNAPQAVADSIKAAGFDVVDLAHNHILDTGLSGLHATVKAFQSIGLETIGVKTKTTEDILVKEVNGIKIALLAYSYGFNGIEASLTDEEYNAHLKDLNMDKVAQDLAQAEKIADFTIVMPQSGVEYALEPSQEQQTNYRKMIDLGADIIFGGHPHVPEPTETITKDGDKKFIIYSMGNLISDQRFESLENYWTERGVVMEVEITKVNGKTSLTAVKAHPTWVDKEPIPGRSYQHVKYGTVPSQDYQVFLAENYLKGGRLADSVSETKRQRIEKAYHEVHKLLDIQF